MIPSPLLHTGKEGNLLELWKKIPALFSLKWCVITVKHKVFCFILIRFSYSVPVYNFIVNFLSKSLGMFFMGVWRWGCGVREMRNVVFSKSSNFSENFKVFMGRQKRNKKPDNSSRAMLSLSWMALCDFTNSSISSIIECMCHFWTLHLKTLWNLKYKNLKEMLVQNTLLYCML